MNEKVKKSLKEPSNESYWFFNDMTDNFDN